jgi:hypothetical protein
LDNPDTVDTAAVGATGILIKEKVPKKRCRTLPAGGLRVFPQTKKSPKFGGFRWLNIAFSVL